MRNESSDDPLPQSDSIVALSLIESKIRQKLLFSWILIVTGLLCIILSFILFIYNTHNIDEKINDWINLNERYCVVFFVAR